MADIEIICGDCLTVLKGIPSESVDCCITSPPYWGLRDYGVEGQLGLEKTPEDYVEKMVEIFREVMRVLKDSATLWLNLGDSYYGGGWKGSDLEKYGDTKQKTNAGTLCGKGLSKDPKHPVIKPKDLVGIPWMVAFALRSDGWYLRQDIIWCLSGGTKVYVKSQKGVMPMTLKDLYRLNPETIRLWNGREWVQLLGMSKSKRTGNEIEIVLRSGERISCSLNHKWPTQRGVIEARDLAVGDTIGYRDLPDNQRENCIGLPCEEIGWFIGIYLAEGSKDSSGTIQIASHKKETERYEKLIDITNQYDGTCRRHITSENGATVCIESKILSAVIDTYIAGRTAKDKHFTTKFWQRDNSFIRNALFGYLEGDGHFGQNRVRLGFTRNYSLESDLRTICARLGYQCRIKLSTSNIGDKEYKSFRGEIRIDVSDHWNTKSDTEIIEIRKSRARLFYDVSVQGEPHLFALASGVLSHNSKPNPMPESVTDRCTKAHEYIFLLSKNKTYYYDNEAIKEDCNWDGNSGAKNYDWINDGRTRNSNQKALSSRNKRSVWTVSTKPFPEAHFATFPEDLIEPCVLAGCPEWVCKKCGRARERIVEKNRINKSYWAQSGKTVEDVRDIGKYGGKLQDGSHIDRKRKEYDIRLGPCVESTTIGWTDCGCHAGFEAGVVLDPFFGAGTTGVVAWKHRRRCIGIELNPEYVRMAESRISNEKDKMALFNGLKDPEGQGKA